MQHSKLAPPPRLKAYALLVDPRAHDLATGRYVFIDPMLDPTVPIMHLDCILYLNPSLLVNVQVFKTRHP